MAFEQPISGDQPPAAVTGIMEAANRGARDAGARSIGLTIGLPFERESDAFLDTLVPFRQFYTRQGEGLIDPGGLELLEPADDAAQICARVSAVAGRI
jgi:hypothetical protein